MMCHNLIFQYLESENNQKNVKVLDSNNNNEDSIKVIQYKMTELYKYLSTVIISIESINSIMNSVVLTNKESVHKAKLIEPLAYFYNFLAKSFTNKIKTLFAKDEKIHWIPDLIAVYLIIDMKEKGYDFKKFPFINNYDFSLLLNIYNKTNLELKKTNDIKLTTPIKNNTIIVKMQNLASTMTDKLINTKYSKK